MRHKDLSNRRIETGFFIDYESGYYTFRLDGNLDIVFEEINKEVLEHYNLKGSQFNGARFQITYDEIVDDEDVIFRLEKLKRL